MSLENEATLEIINSLGGLDNCKTQVKRAITDFVAAIQADCTTAPVVEEEIKAGKEKAKEKAKKQIATLVQNVMQKKSNRGAANTARAAAAAPKAPVAIESAPTKATVAAGSKPRTAPAVKKLSGPRGPSSQEVIQIEQVQQPKFKARSAPAAEHVKTAVAANKKSNTVTTSAVHNSVSLGEVDVSSHDALVQKIAHSVLQSLSSRLPAAGAAVVHDPGTMQQVLKGKATELHNNSSSSISKKRKKKYASTSSDSCSSASSVSSSSGSSSSTSKKYKKKKKKNSEGDLERNQKKLHK
jgi:hypothetical protein